MLHNRVVSDFSTRLLTRRSELGWTQKDLADRSGLSSRTIANYEIYGRTPNMANLDKLAKTLNVSMAWLSGQADHSAKTAGVGPPALETRVVISDDTKPYGSAFGERLSRLSGRVRKLPDGLRMDAMDYLDGALDEFLTAAAIGGVNGPSLRSKGDSPGASSRSGTGGKGQ